MVRLSPRALIKFVAPKQGKPMVFPVTNTARLAHWNVIYDLRNNVLLRYSLLGACVVFPVIWYIDGLVNSPGAKAAFKAAQKREHEKEHLAHMWADIQGRYASR